MRGNPDFFGQSVFDSMGILSQATANIIIPNDGRAIDVINISGKCIIKHLELLLSISSRTENLRIGVSLDNDDFIYSYYQLPASIKQLANYGTLFSIESYLPYDGYYKLVLRNEIKIMSSFIITGKGGFITNQIVSYDYILEQIL
jgi:hypothetical protein